MLALRRARRTYRNISRTLGVAPSSVGRVASAPPQAGRRWQDLAHGWKEVPTAGRPRHDTTPSSLFEGLDGCNANGPGAWIIIIPAEVCPVNFGLDACIEPIGLFRSER